MPKSRADRRSKLIARRAAAAAAAAGVKAQVKADAAKEAETQRKLKNLPDPYAVPDQPRNETERTIPSFKEYYINEDTPWSRKPLSIAAGLLLVASGCVSIFPDMSCPPLEALPDTDPRWEENGQSAEMNKAIIEFTIKTFGRPPNRLDYSSNKEWRRDTEIFMQRLAKWWQEEGMEKFFEERERKMKNTI